MKRKFALVILTFMMFLGFASGCSCFNNDDLTFYSEEDLFRIYRAGAERINTYDNFTAKTVTTTTFNGVSYNENVAFTRNENGYYVSFVKDQVEA